MDEAHDGTTTEELRAVQVAREGQARQAAERADTDEETAQHDRRASKSAYLRDKLEQRQQAERKADQERR